MNAETLQPRRLFTRGQLEVMRLIACGHSHEEAAAALQLRLSSISESLHRARQRVGLRSTPQLIAFAIASGAIDLAPILAAASLAPVHHG